MKVSSMNTILSIQHQTMQPKPSIAQRSYGKWVKSFASGISLVLIASLFIGCTTPFRAPMPQTADLQAPQVHKNANAPYNRSYSVRGQTYHPMRTAVGYSEKGIASWYGTESGNRTAMGTRFNPHNLTAAHKTLPLPTKVKVTNLRNGRSVNVIVNDRGPFRKNRLIDLSYGAAKKIGMEKQGLTKVKVEYLDTLATK